MKQASYGRCHIVNARMLFTNKSAVGKCDGKWSYARAKKLNSIRAWSERKKEKHERISCSAKGNVCKNFDYF